MITALSLIRATIDSGQPLSSLTSGFQRYPQVLVNIRVREKLPFGDLLGVQKVVAEVQERLSQNGRLLLRYSGTEALARVMIEGANQTEIETYAQQIAREIQREIGAASSVS